MSGQGLGLIGNHLCEDHWLLFASRGVSDFNCTARGETVEFDAPLLVTVNFRDLRSRFFDVQKRLTRERPGEVGSQLWQVRRSAEDVPSWVRVPGLVK